MRKGGVGADQESHSGDDSKPPKTGEGISSNKNLKDVFDSKPTTSTPPSDNIEAHRQSAADANDLIRQSAPQQSDSASKNERTIKEQTNMQTTAGLAHDVRVVSQDGSLQQMTRIKADDGRTSLYSRAGADGKEQLFRQDGAKLVQTDRSGAAIPNGESLNIKSIQVGRQFAQPSQSGSDAQSPTAGNRTNQPNSGDGASRKDHGNSAISDVVAQTAKRSDISAESSQPKIPPTSKVSDGPPGTLGRQGAPPDTSLHANHTTNTNSPRSDVAGPARPANEEQRRHGQLNDSNTAKNPPQRENPATAPANSHTDSRTPSSHSVPADSKQSAGGPTGAPVGDRANPLAHTDKPQSDHLEHLAHGPSTRLNETPMRGPVDPVRGPGARAETARTDADRREVLDQTPGNAPHGRPSDKPQLGDKPSIIPIPLPIGKEGPGGIGGASGGGGRGAAGDAGARGDRGGRPTPGDRGSGGAGGGGGGRGPGDGPSATDRAGKPTPAGDRGGRGEGVSGGRGGRADIPIEQLAPDGKPRRPVDARLLELLADPKLQSKMLDTLQTVAADRDGIRSPRIRELFAGLDDKQIWQMQMGLLDGVRNPLAFDNLSPLLQGKLIQLAEILGGKEILTGRGLDAITRDGKVTPGSETLTTVIRDIDRTSRIFQTGDRTSREILADMLTRTLDNEGTNKTFTLQLDQDQTATLVSHLQNDVLAIIARRGLDDHSDDSLDEDIARIDDGDDVDGLQTTSLAQRSLEISRRNAASSSADFDDDSVDFTSDCDDEPTVDHGKFYGKTQRHASLDSTKNEAKEDQRKVTRTDSDDSVVPGGVTPEAMAARAAKKIEDERKRRERQEDELREEKRRSENERKNRRESHRVSHGDSLVTIAQKRCRDTTLAPLIYDINRAQIPATFQGPTRFALLKVGQVLSLPSETDTKNYKSGRPKHTNVDMSLRAGDGSNSSEAFPSVEAELAAKLGIPFPGHTRGGKRVFDAKDVKGSRTDAVRQKVRENRHNIEAALGPLRPKPKVRTESRIKYMCRIGDTLRSIAQRHPSLHNAELWQLIAYVNELPTEVNSKNEPIAKLKRGQSLLLPTPAEIHAWLAMLSGEQTDFVLWEFAYIEMNRRECPHCDRPTLVSVVVCPGCAFYMDDDESLQYDRAEQGSYEILPEDKATAPRIQENEDDHGSTRVLKEPPLPVLDQTSEDDYTGTAKIKHPADDDVPDSTRKVSNGKPDELSSHTAASRAPMAPQSKNPSTSGISPGSVRKVSQNDSPAQDPQYFCAYARLIFEGSVEKVSNGYSITLEGYTDNGWRQMVTYEFADDSIYHHIFYATAKKKSHRLALPLKQAMELAQNDLAKNWQHYYSAYSREK